MGKKDSSPTKFEADTKKLKELVANRGFSSSKFSELLNHHRGWFSQIASRSDNKCNMKLRDAENICKLLNCSLQDFRSQDEPIWNPIVFDYDKQLEEMHRQLENIPVQHRYICEKFLAAMLDPRRDRSIYIDEFLSFVANASIEDCNAMRAFFAREGLGKVKTRQFGDGKHWFTEYFVDNFFDTIYTRFYNSLECFNIFDDDRLRDKVIELKKRSNQREDGRFRQNVNKLVREYYIAPIEQSIESALESLCRDMSNFLIEYYIHKSYKTETIVSTLKERIEKDR